MRSGAHQYVTFGEPTAKAPPVPLADLASMRSRSLPRTLRSTGTVWPRPTTSSTAVRAAPPSPCQSSHRVLLPRALPDRDCPSTIRRTLAGHI